MEKSEYNRSLLTKIDNELAEGNLLSAGKTLNSLHPAEIAHVLESLPAEDRLIAWDLVDSAVDGDVLIYVNDEVRSSLIREMDRDELLAATGTLPTDDLADILPDLPENIINELLRSMDTQNRERLETILRYPEDTAGGIMRVDAVTIRPDVSLDVILRYLRFMGKLPDNTNSLMVVNREGRYLGQLVLSDLVTLNVDNTVAEVMKTDTPLIPASMEENEVAQIFEKLDLLSAPVVDNEDKLVGRITIEDIVDVIRDEANHSIMRRAGLNEETDMFAPVVRSSRRRAVWLGINLLTALLASWVIGLFGATIEKLVALAVLMPVVASMGGIAGSQTLTLVIRGIALGHVGRSNALILLRKELSVGAVNGVVWAVVIGFVAAAWFNSVSLGIVIGLAILCNLIVAALSGAIIPLGLYRLGADPALAGGVVLTTITDVVGFFVFLGLAAMFLV
ncbi:MAG: magnesium transporter [Gammaproteobacteria bacterium]|nr:magnesium transporter [Gammaproteobacteria bacterium]MDH5692602.1 magnesium transporter [Gammaproteobacteria bacterium]